MEKFTFLAPHNWNFRVSFQCRRSIRRKLYRTAYYMNFFFIVGLHNLTPRFQNYVAVQAVAYECIYNTLNVSYTLHQHIAYL